MRTHTNTRTEWHACWNGMRWNDTDTMMVCTHQHAHRVACALARWNGMRWDVTDTVMACTPPRWRRRRPGRVCCSRDECRASRNGCSRDRSDLCAQRSPSRLRSSGHAFQRFLRRSARTKTAAARAAARAHDARSRRARWVRRSDGRRHEGRERSRHGGSNCLPASLLACLLGRYETNERMRMAKYRQS